MIVVENMDVWVGRQSGVIDAEAKVAEAFGNDDDDDDHV